MFGRIIIVVATLAMLGLATLGVVSYYRGVPDKDIWIEPTQTSKWQYAVVGGIVHIVHSAPRVIGGQDRDDNFAGFYVRRVVIGPTEAFGVGGPIWWLVGLLAVVPFVGFVRGPVRRWRRRRRGLCTRCGYSLQGAPGPLCPECGQKMPAKTAPPATSDVTPAV